MEPMGLMGIPVLCTPLTHTHTQAHAHGEKVQPAAVATEYKQETDCAA